MLLDTADKSGPGLRALLTPAVLGRWVAEKQHEGPIAGRAGGPVDGGGFSPSCETPAPISPACAALRAKAERAGRVSPRRVAVLRGLVNRLKADPTHAIATSAIPPSAIPPTYATPPTVRGIRL